MTVASVYGMPQVLMPAASLTGGAACPSVATGRARVYGVRTTWAVVIASAVFRAVYVQGCWVLIVLLV